jgi:hypothetical protein
MNEEIDVQASVPEAINESEVQADATDEPVEDVIPVGECTDEAIADKEDLFPAVSQDPAPDLCLPQATDAEVRAEQLERELNDLKAQIAERDARDARVEREYAEFRALYPDVPLSELSDAVQKQVESGTPLAAAFALEERKKLLLTKKAEETNIENRHRSSGSVNGTDSPYFSPQEVRAMSRAEIRRNYDRIIESMKSWH